MNGRKTVTYFVISAAALLALSAGVPHLARAQVTTLTVSGDVAMLPHRADIMYAPMAQSESRVTVGQAVQAAEAGFGITDGQLDLTTPMVHTLVSIAGDTHRQNERAWIVTANYDIVSPGNGLLYHKVCIVVDAVTGQYQYAYVVDPDQAQLRNASSVTTSSTSK